MSSLHSLSPKKQKKKNKKNFNYQLWSHSPILSQANKSRLSISQNWFLEMCSKKMKCVWCSTEKRREFVWGMHKEGRQRLPHSFCCSTVSCPLSHSCFHAHTHMQTRCVQCVHKLNYTHKKCAHTHEPPHTYTHSTTLRAASECYKQTFTMW